MTNTVNNEGLSAKDLILAFIVSLVLMFLAGSGYAQGIATAKAANATEVASVAKEVKSTIVVPAKLVKAMEVAKTPEKKAGKQTTFVFFYTENTESGITDTANWSVNAPPGQLCNGDDLPCRVEFTSTQYSSLQAFLTANPTISQMRESGLVDFKPEE